MIQVKQDRMYFAVSYGFVRYALVIQWHDKLLSISGDYDWVNSGNLRDI
jgi:hypothetical protein